MTRKEVREENEKEVVDAQNKHMTVLKKAYSSNRQKETSNPPNTDADADAEVVSTKGKEKKNPKRQSKLHFHPVAVKKKLSPADC